MVDESELRSHLADSTAPAITIDAYAVIARSRARRRPRQFAVGAAGVLAAASLVFAGVTTFPRTPDLTTAGIMADESSTRMDSESNAGSAESFLAPEDAAFAETCGAIIPPTAASPRGLALEIDIPSPVTASGSAFGTVRLTNTSDSAVTGTTASVPDVNLIRDDVSISHTPDAQILTVVPVNLQPGQSIEFAVSVAIYDCTTIDTGGMLEPGIYSVNTSLAFVPTEPDTGEATEVRSAPKTIVLQ
ncbi:MAG: hypothetical protein ACOH1M_07590 [Rhodoglobus sp.]